MSFSRVERCYNIAELRKLAKKNMPAPMFHYIDGAADDEWTLRRNTAAFDSVEFMPRALVDVSTIDMSTTLFGQRIDWPYFCAPTALQRLFHHEGEGRHGARRACERHDLLAVERLVDEHRGRGEAVPGAQGVPGVYVQGPGLSRNSCSAPRTPVTSRCSSRSTSPSRAIASATS